MKNLSLFLILLFLTTAFCVNSNKLYAREKYRNENVVSVFEKNEIKSMEEILFNYSFDSDTIPKRLERLELKVFNVISTDSYKNRISALKNALNASRNNYTQTYTTYTNVQPYYQYSYGRVNPYFNMTNYNPYFRPPKMYPNRLHNPKLNALRRLRSYFNGTMTGYTLPVQNNYMYNNPYYNPNNNFFSNGGSSQVYTGNGFSYYNNSVNDGGVSVKIID